MSTAQQQNDLKNEADNINGTAAHDHANKQRKP